MNKAAKIDLPAPVELPIFVGKDILELLSSSMYVNPLAIYREYVQNAVDAIDEAVAAGCLASFAKSSIEISLSQPERRITIRDNGAGLSNDTFARKMLSFGASDKRGTDARGFRGVGRLSGLGYAQELVFRSRSAGDPTVFEAVWDGRVVKQLLSSKDPALDLETIVRSSVSIKPVDPADYPDHFFEVELNKPRRIANDRLLNEAEVEFFLAQTCPCPFSPDFSGASEINNLLAPYGRAGRSYRILLNGSETPIVRPYRNTVTYSESKTAKLGKLRRVEIEGLDGEVAAIGWLFHHDYQGAIPAAQGVHGLRARVGNIQIGNHRILADVFPEDRFCSWTIGEVHILDSRVVPNGRRDDFEANGHLDNIFMHLRPVASEIARECRVSSQRRNRLKTFELGAGKVAEKLEVLQQGAVSERYGKVVKGEIGSVLAEMRNVVDFEMFEDDDKADLKSRYEEIESQVDTYSKKLDGSVLENLPQRQRVLYKKVFELIYDCSVNKVAAKSLVDRMLERLSRA